MTIWYRFILKLIVLFKKNEQNQNTFLKAWMWTSTLPHCSLTLHTCSYRSSTCASPWSPVFWENLKLFPPEFYNFPLTIWQRGKLWAFVTICVSVVFFFYPDFWQHRTRWNGLFSAEGGLLHNSHKKRSLLIVFCRVVFAHIIRACVCVHPWNSEKPNF